MLFMGEYSLGGRNKCTLRKSLASIWISLGKVAENIRVCLTSGPGMLSL